MRNLSRKRTSKNKMKMTTMRKRKIKRRPRLANWA